MFSRTSGVTGATVPARSRPSKLPRCAKSWPVIQNHSLNPIYWEFLLTLSFLAVHPLGLRHPNRARLQNPASHPNHKGSGGVSRILGSTGCQPVVVGSLPTTPTRCKNSSQRTFEEAFRQGLPKRQASGSCQWFPAQVSSLSNVVALSSRLSPLCQK